MNKRFIKEGLVEAVLILILLTFLKTSSLLMPMSFDALLIIGLIIFFFLFLTLVWKEKVADERDQIHRSDAGRISFMAGSIVLLLGIVTQSLSHNIDPWLIITLIAMIFVKIAARIYSQIKN